MNTKEMTTSRGECSAGTINHQDLLNRFNYLTEGMDDWKMYMQLHSHRTFR